jgi:purine-nucleoside phosphorylase
MINVTKSNFISKIYFNKIYQLIISIGKFEKKKIILDFGCGLGGLKKINFEKKNKSKIINYDIIKKLSDVNKYNNLNFDTIVFCQVLYLFKKKKIIMLLKKLKRQNKDLEIIVVYSTQSIVNKVFAFFLGHVDAHNNTVTTPEEERELLLNQCYLIKEINYLNLFRIIMLKFK